jgi:hypothetical protein
MIGMERILMHGLRTVIRNAAAIQTETLNSFKKVKEKNLVEETLLQLLICLIGLKIGSSA